MRVFFPFGPVLERTGSARLLQSSSNTGCLPLFSPFSGYSSGVLFHLFLGKRDVTAVQRFWEVGCGESLRLKIPSNPVLERARALRLLQSSIYYILRDVWGGGKGMLF